MNQINKTRFWFMIVLFLGVVITGCQAPTATNAVDGSPKADLSTIWRTCKDHYRKTESMPPPNMIPNCLAVRYNYEFTAGISLNEHSTNVIAYQGKPNHNKRYVLFSDGRIKQLSDSELRTLGVEPDATKQRNQEDDNQKRIDEFNRKLGQYSNDKLP